MKIERLKDFKPNKNYISKYTRMNDIIEVVTMSHKNSECPIKKIKRLGQYLTRPQRRRILHLYFEEIPCTSCCCKVLRDFFMSFRKEVVKWKKNYFEIYFLIT